MKTQEKALTHTIRIGTQPTQVITPTVAAKRPILLRHVIGDQLRNLRQEQNRTLREVSRAAKVSLGYLSEVERGQKEASSELLASICGALNTSLSDLLIDVSADVARQEAKFDLIPAL